MADLISLVTEVVQDVEHQGVRDALQTAFDSSSDSLSDVESSFINFTSSMQTKECLNRFFHNWSMTNNSAIGLSGFCNRLTMRWKNETPSGLGKSRSHKYMNVISHLNRVTDEDLGATGGKLHYDLYYQMATTISDSDDWLSRRYLLDQGAEFKRWKDHFMVREKDLFMGFLITLIHEVYTHGEVEFILPLFSDWLAQTTELNERQRRRCLLWIEVHTKGTERNHFNETLSAFEDLAELLERNLDDYDLVAIFSEYLAKKAGVMSALNVCIKRSNPLSLFTAQASY